MVKTKDYVISTTDEQTSYKIPNKKNSIYLKGIKQSDVDITSFKIVNDNLLFTANDRNYTISNYKGIKYIKTNNDNKIELLDIITSNCVDNTNEIKSYNTKKLTVTGTNYNDKINLSESGYAPKGKTNIKKNKGLTISGGNGNDEITGTDYNDIIKGGNGNDIIEGGVGADTITGGAGITVINYIKGDGNDVINLTKGEQFTLNIDGVTDITDLKFEYANKNKDLRIYTDKNSTAEYLTIKNFATKDVTNNSNAKKSIIDSSSVELVVGGKTYDLRTSKNITDNEDIVLYKTTLGENAKNFTGTWLNDEIDANSVKLYKKVKKQTVEKELKDTGLTLKGGAGNDTITGTKYSDKIYGNTGSDTINAGTGSNYIYFNKGDGHDVIENGNGVDTLVFAKKTKLSYSFNKYDLIVKYSDKDSITLKDYFKGHSVQYVQIGTKKTVFNPPKPQIKESNEEGYHIFQGTDIDDTINGTVGNDKIYSNGGIDTINGKKGNDIIYCSDEEQTLEFETGSDSDIVILGNGIQTVKLLYDNSDGVTDVVYTKENNNLVITKTKTYNATEIETTVYKDYQGNYTLSPTITLRNQSITVYRDNDGNLTENATRIEDNTLVTSPVYKDKNGHLTLSSTHQENNVKIPTGTIIYKYFNFSQRLNQSGGVHYFPTPTHIYYYDKGSSTDILEGEKIVVGYGSNANLYYGTIADSSNPHGQSRPGYYDEIYVTKSSTHEVSNVQYNGNVYYDKNGNLTTSSTSIINNTKLNGYYKDYLGNYTTNSTTTLDNEVVEGTYYLDLDENIVAEKHRTIDEITITDYFISDTDKTSIEFNNSGKSNLEEYIADKLNEKFVLVDNGENTTVITKSGINTLIFPDNTDLIYERDITSDDLIIRFGNSTVTVKDYFKDNIHSVKNTIGNTNIPLSEAVETNGLNTIYLNSGLNTVEINNSDFEILSYVKSNSDLVISSNRDNYILKKFFNENNTIQNIKVGDNTELLSNKIKLYFEGSNIGETIIGTDYNDIITAHEGNDVINGGKGYNTQIFSVGDGQDTIINGEGTDTVQLTTTEILNYVHDWVAHDLIIHYSENDFIRLKDYFVNNNHSVQTIVNGDVVIDDIEEVIKNNLSIVGSENADIIQGTTFNDVIYGYAENDTIYTKSGTDTVYAGTGSNNIIIDGTGNKNINTAIGGNDTISLTITPSTSGSITVDYEGTKTYSTNNSSNLLNRYGNDLVVNYTDNDFVKISDFFNNIETYGNKINMKESNSLSYNTVTQLQGSYKIPVNVRYATNIDNEVLEIVANANNNIYSNPNKKNNVIFTSANTNTNATYNVNLYGGGQIDTYGDMDYTFNLYEESEVNVDSGTTELTLNLKSNSMTTLNCNITGTIIVNVDSDYSAKLDINTYETELTKTNTKFIREEGSDDLKISNTFNESEGLIILKDFFKANNGQGYQFGIHSQNIDISAESTTNPLSELGLNLTSTDYTYTGQTIYDEFIDVSSETWANHTIYNNAVNGVAGNDVFRGSSQKDTYYCELPTSGLTTITDNNYELILSGGVNVFVEVKDNNSNHQSYSRGKVYITRDSIQELQSDPLNGVCVQSGYINIYKDNKQTKINDSMISIVTSMVASWLRDNNYASTTEAFEKASADGKDITQMLAYYSNIGWQVNN